MKRTSKWQKKKTLPIITIVTKEDRLLEKHHLTWMSNYDIFTAFTFKRNDLMFYKLKSILIDATFLNSYSL